MHVSGGKIAACKMYLLHKLDDPMRQVFAHSRLYNSGQVRMDITPWKIIITPLGQQLWVVTEEDKARILSVWNGPGTTLASAIPVHSQQKGSPKMLKRH